MMHSPTENNDNSHHASPHNTNNNLSCPSCNLPNPIFSNNQRKKKYTDRKCKLCIEKLLASSSPTHTSSPEQSCCSSPLSASKKKKERKRAKRAKTNHDALLNDGSNSNIDNNGGTNQLIENNHQEEEQDYEDCKATMSKYFQKSENKQAASEQLHGNDDDGDISSDSGSDNNNDNVGRCWSPPMQSDNENEHELCDIGLDDTPIAPTHAGGGSKYNHTKSNNGNNGKNHHQQHNNDKYKKKNDSKRNNVRDKMEMARNAALGNNTKSDSDDEDNDKGGGRAIKQPSHGNNNHGNKKEEESLDAIKHKILGRSISSMYDIDHVSEAALSSSTSNQQQPITNASNFEDGSTVANHLRQELSCPICHDRLYNPSSLLCGHSFCMACLNWWLDRQQQQQQQGQNHGVGRGMMDEDDGDSGDESSSSWQGTCPSCREPIPPSINSNGECSSKPNMQVNTALKAVLNTLYGTEMNQRRQAEQRQKLKAQSGEMGGMHTRGCEEIVPLADEKDELGFIREMLIIKGGENGNNRRNRYEDEENGWIALHSSSNQPGWQSNGEGYSHGKGGSSSVMIRRNIVLDEIDQRYQLSLGLTKCSYSNSNSNTKYAAVKTNNGKSSGNGNGCIQYGVLDIELCILTMEEDEVDDSGFPTFVNEGDDDEALICTGNDKMHTCIEAAARVVSLSEIENVVGKLNIMPRANKGGGNSSSQVRELSLSRGMIGRDGAVRFRIDLDKALTEGPGGDLHVVKLRFVHVDTGAVLELRLPSKIATEGDNSDGEIEFCGTSKRTAAMNDASRYLLNDHDEDEDDDEPNEYQEDGFVVHGSQDSSDNEFDDEEDDDDDDDDGECQICKNGGDLIVCDGGDHDGGCGHMYHIHCIGRSTVPPGDWICKACASDHGINVGIEGHEYDVGGSEDEDDNDDKSNNNKNELLALDSDSDDEDVVHIPKKKAERQSKRKVIDLSESDDSDEGELVDSLQKKKKRTKGNE